MKVWSAGEEVLADDLNDNFDELNVRNDISARAYLSGSNQSITTGASPVKVQFNAESYDIGSNFDSATNYRFTCPTAGRYLISSTIEIKANASDYAKRPIIFIYKNGSEYSRCTLGIGDPEVGVGQGLSHSVQITDILNVSASDYIEIFVVTGASLTPSMILGEGKTFVSIHKLS